MAVTLEQGGHGVPERHPADKPESNQQPLQRTDHLSKARAALSRTAAGQKKPAPAGPPLGPASLDASKGVRALSVLGRREWKAHVEAMAREFVVRVPTSERGAVALLDRDVPRRSSPNERQRTTRSRHRGNAARGGGKEAAKAGGKESRAGPTVRCLTAPSASSYISKNSFLVRWA